MRINLDDRRWLWQDIQDAIVVVLVVGMAVAAFAAVVVR